METEIATLVCSSFTIFELAAARQASCMWRAACDEPTLWINLAKYHFHGDLGKGVHSVREFGQTVLKLRLALTQQAGRDLTLLTAISHSHQPCPPALKSGAELLVERQFHERLLISLLRDSADCADRVKFLSSLCDQSPAAVRQLRLLLSRFDIGYSLLVHELFMSHLLELEELQPDVVDRYHRDVVHRFGSLDWRLLQAENPHLSVLKALGGIEFHLLSLSGDVHSEFSPAWRRDATSAAMELTGNWCTAIALDGRRLEDVPGDMQIEFQPSGLLQGHGRDNVDPFSTFRVAGFWTLDVVLIRKIAAGYSVDLLGFFQDDGTMRGSWLLQTNCGGFWAWKGTPRFRTH